MAKAIIGLPDLGKKGKGEREWLPVFQGFIDELRIQSKEVAADDERGTKLHLWGSQKIFLENICAGMDQGVRQFFCLKSRQLGLCLDPETRVLTADLRWIKIKDLTPGTEIVSVDEYPPGGVGNHRKMRTGKVEAVIHLRRHAYKISFDDGRYVICTGQHPWLSKTGANVETAWRSIERRKKCGPKLRVGHSVRWVTTPWTDGDIEDGWFGGMLDGEGSISNENRSGVAVLACQKHGPVWDRLVEYASRRGYNCTTENDLTIRKTKFGVQPCPKLVFSRQDEVFRLLGQTRPTRFIGRRFWEGRELPGKKSGIGWSKIVSIEELGDRDVIDLQTTTGTYIAEGFVSHNTTVSLAIDLFWLAVHPRMLGVLVADNDANRDFFRKTLQNYYDSLPEEFTGDEFRKIKDNSGYMEFSNGSRLDFLVAGTRKKTWGEGRGYTLAHVTEVAKFGTPEGIASFQETLAETHPDRLFTWESTALGYNHWKDMYEAAQDDVYTKRAFFIGWWSKEINSIPKKDPRFQLYGQPPNKEEREKMALVRQRHNIIISAEQLAWRRERDADSSKSKADNDQNQPWLEEEAFVQSGFSFFQTRLLSQLYNFISDPVNDVRYKPFKFELSNQFHTSKMYPITLEEVQVQGYEIVELRLWHEPVDGATYVIGFDPAYGRTDHGDRSAISVWRCFADRMVQCAEYADNKVETHQAAWVLAFLAGIYKDCLVNIELTGPGRAVFKELDDLRMKYRSEPYEKISRDRDWDDFLSQARHYLYHRPDSLGGGYAYHTEMTWSIKGRVLNQLRDSYTTGILQIKSLPLVAEMMSVVQDGSEIAAPGTQKDDRVFALLLAHMAYKDHIQASMIQNGQTYSEVMQSEEVQVSGAGTMVKYIVQNFWKTRTEKLENPDPPEPTFLEEKGL